MPNIVSIGEHSSRTQLLKAGQLFLLVTCAVVACAPVNGVNEDHRIPVVNAVLKNGQPAESLTVMWAGTPDDPYPPSGPAPGDVNLWITSTAGDSVAVVPPGLSGLYTIALTPHSGVTYRLGGTILGTSVHATTTVPTLAIRSPASGDTLNASVFDPHHFEALEFPIDLAASGAAGFDVHSSVVVEGQQGYLLSPLDTLTVFYHGPGSLAVHADIFAFDSNAATFYGVVQTNQPGGPFVGGLGTGTVTGALGLFGSSTSAPLDVVIVP